MYKTIKFKKNYNGKLSNEFFTTIRNANYAVAPGDYCVIVLNDKVFKWVQCVSSTSMWIMDIPPVVLITDTGLNEIEAKALLITCGIRAERSAEMIDLILLKTVDRPQKLRGDKGQESLSSLWDNIE